MTDFARRPPGVPALACRSHCWAKKADEPAPSPPARRKLLPPTADVATPGIGSGMSLHTATVVNASKCADASQLTDGGGNQPARSIKSGNAQATSSSSTAAASQESVTTSLRSTP